MNLSAGCVNALDALGPLPAPSCSASSCSPTSNGPTGSASSGGYPESRAFAELLIDSEEDWILQAVLVGMLREADR
jgi:hypothetical protein